MIVSPWIAYWAIGVFLTMLPLDEDAIDDLREYGRVEEVPAGEYILRVTVFIVILILAFFWPLILVASYLRNRD